jgi:hypothetical protein
MVLSICSDCKLSLGSGKKWSLRELPSACMYCNSDVEGDSLRGVQGIIKAHRSISHLSGYLCTTQVIRPANSLTPGGRAISTTTKPILLLLVVSALRLHDTARLLRLLRLLQNSVLIITDWRIQHER